MFACLEEPVLECTCTFSVCSQHYNQVLSNPILYSQSALCNHYETVEMRNQSSHHSFCTRSRSHADNSIALVSVSTLLFLVALNLLFPQDFLRVFLDFLSLFISSLCRMCTWTSTASCRWATGCWSRVTTPPSRSSRSQASWRRSGRPLPRHWMNAARCWRCRPASTRNVTRWIWNKFR